MRLRTTSALAFQVAEVDASRVNTWWRQHRLNDQEWAVRYLESFAPYEIGLTGGFND